MKWVSITPPRKGLQRFKIARRFLSLGREVRYAFAISVISIFLIELWFRNIPSPSETFFRAGEIYLRLCYSITASVIFFFINQHLPKEEKRVRLAGFLRVSSGRLTQEVQEILWEALKLRHPLPHIVDNVSYKDKIAIACKNTKADKPVISTFGDLEFKDWKTYMEYKIRRIDDLIESFLIFEDLIDKNILLEILNTKRSMAYLTHPFVDSDTLERYSGSLFNIFNSTAKVALFYLPTSNEYWREHKEVFGITKRQEEYFQKLNESHKD